VGVNRASEYCKKNSIDIYHSHLPYAAAFGVFLKIPRIYTHHSVEPRLSKLMYKGFNKVIDHYVGISEVCAEALRSYTKRSVSTIMNGVDPNKLLRRQRENVVNRKMEALAIGRITPQKDYYFLVDSVKILPKGDRQRLHIRIAGEGESCYTQALKAYVSKNNLEDNFEFLGNRSDIPELIDSSDMFLMSSAYEGLPIALIEATVSGLPCLVTDVGGCREIINSCDNGFAIPQGRKEAYALALSDLINESNLYRRCSFNAIVNSEELSILRSSKSHEKLYIKALSNKA
jgi:glycosyltransferase involved in cell wall biosynthesis